LRIALAGSCSIFCSTKIVGEQGTPHTWRLHDYKDIGRIPRNLNPSKDPSKRILLDQLPRILRGHGRTKNVDAVVVLLDSDNRDCKSFLKELQQSAAGCGEIPTTLFRLAIEELEAWYFGDRKAILNAYPRAKVDPPVA
jgi:hypothetical protein